jgi:putative membrane protein
MDKFMKKCTLLFFAISLCFIGCSTSKQQDSVDQSDSTNEERAKRYLLDEPSAEFLVKIADGRLMGIKEGQAAETKGTYYDIRSYGMLMVKDQKRLLAVMKTLAVHKKIQLPQQISADKEEGLKELLDKKGEDFDSKFIKMMRIDHERDIRLFTDALHAKDDEIRAFAVKYLPLIQQHLDKLNALKK